MKTIIRTAGIGIGLTIVAGTLLGGWWYGANQQKPLPVSPQLA